MTYEVEYSKRKSISISVRGGRVLVKAPMKTSDKTIEAVVFKHRAWIEKHLAKALEKERPEDSLTEEKIKLLKKEARAYLKEKTEYYSEIMGLKYSRITITSAKTRFGSCSSKGNISYSYRLMLYPEAAREYVVVHELAHLVHMNHSKEFYGIVERYLPDYKDRRKMLKRIPQ